MKSLLNQEDGGKTEFLYVRLDAETMKKIKKLQKRLKFNNKSKAVRSLIRWAFENGVDQK